MINSQRTAVYVLVALPLVVAALHAQEPAADDDRSERIALGRLAFDNSCRMCHEPELVRQQRLTPAQWDAEIEKMIGWGATLAPEERPNLHSYLVAEFGPANHPASRTTDGLIAKPPASFLEFADPAGDQLEGGVRLYAQHCINCHGPDACGGEPGQNLVEQEILLRPDDFRAVTQAGRYKMPAFAEVLDAPSIDAIRAWLVSLEYDPR